MSEGRPDQLQLEWVPGCFAVCRLGAGEAVPEWAVFDGSTGLVSVTRTDDELSIVVGEEQVPPSIDAERGWIAMRIGGTLNFTLIGILSRLTGALADARVSVFAISTHDTDILLVKSKDAGRAIEALRAVADCTLLQDP